MSKLPEPPQDALVPAAQAERAATSSSLDESRAGEAADRTITGTVLEVEREFIWIETGDARAKLYASELMLDIGEVPADRYAPGDHFAAFVFRMEPDPESGAQQFSIRRAAPYPNLLNSLEVGSVIAQATVVNTYDVGIELDVDGVRGNAFFDELPLAHNESPHDRYQPGDTIDDLLVWQINHDARVLLFSVRRNAPSYVEALNARSVGDVVSATVTGFTSNGGLWLNVGGVIGGAGPQELSIADGESAQDRYAVGDTVHDLFVWQVDRDIRVLLLSVRRNAPDYVEALNAHSVGDVVSATVTGFPSNDGLWLDVGGAIGGVEPWDLPLADGESTQDRYSVGDTIDDIFVWQVNRDARDLFLSVRRNAPDYVEALNVHSVGDVVSATVRGFPSNGGLWLNVGGVIGSVPPWDLPFADDKSAQDRYSVGDTVDAIFVWQVNRDDRDLSLSVRRNAPDYVEALNAHSVGDVVSATVTGFTSNGGLWLDVGGVIGSVEPWDLPLADGESTQDRYSVGDTIDDIFVWQVNRDARDLFLSVRRNAPDYVEALNVHSVGDVVSATVRGFPSNGGLYLDVGGVIGGVPPWDLPLADGESAQDRYAVGDTAHDLFVWQVSRDKRDLSLSVRRNAPDYVEALNAHSVGEVVSATVTLANKWGLWLDVAGVVGWIPTGNLDLDDGESLTKRYSIGDPIAAHVWQIDRESRDVILSVRRLGLDSIEEPTTPGATIDVVVRDSRPGGTEVLVASQTIRIPHCELSLGIGERTRFEYGHGIRVVVLALDSEGNPLALSHRKALPGWQAEVDRLAPGVILPDAQVVPRRAVPESEDRAAIDLGPVNGFVRRDELDVQQAEELMMDEPNTQYPVVVESIEGNGVDVIVSHARFEERWRELAANISENTDLNAELRSLSGGTAMFDLGSGLLGQMPFAPRPGKPSILRRQDLGKTFPLRVTAIDAERHYIAVEHRDQWLEGLIGEPESQTLEFKEVLKGDKGADDAKEMTRQAIRTINAFLNADGGRLIIGVHDRSREITGLEGDPGLDADTTEKKIDQATQILETNLANLEPLDLLRDDLSGLVTWETPSVRGRTLLVITCKRGPDAGVNLKIKGKPEFWMRDGSSKKALRTQNEIRDHLRTRLQRAATAGDKALDD